ncbi:TetR/AcrR family transcriptional regulator [Rhodococcoides corynebacterioides]|uniref:TetR/AcrR family transcriptional regulator n=1 Tax=Rhodococcoides corynebacterioides TaxID=53972 RepID=UPI001C9A79B1|nr:TetR/AcrR family transcriptional regulator [Rhodococcus corynebacterioides]MBY6348895.1 TetR/AcrR family transcriptional regulator [Rhodococcus corynebacterioides]
MVVPAARSYAGRSAHDRRVERRDRLIDAAITVFATTGYAASSVSEICTHANLSTRQFYAEFADREEILGAAYDLVNTNASAVVAAAAAATVDDQFDIRLRKIVHSYLAEIVRDPRHARIAFVEVVGVSAPMEAKRHARVEAWIELLDLAAAPAVASGELPSRDYRLAWIGYIGAVNALVAHRTLNSPHTPIDDLVEELVRMARSGVLH